MKKARIILILILIIFITGMICSMNTVSAKQYKNKKSITLKIKDGKKTIKLKCKYDKELQQYTGIKIMKNKKSQYYAWISYAKTKYSSQFGKKGWNTAVFKDDLTRKHAEEYKTGLGINKYRPITKIKLYTWKYGLEINNISRNSTSPPIPSIIVVSNHY